MSENEHVAAIRSSLNRMRDRTRSWDDKLNGATAIEHHLDALAAQLAEVQRHREDTKDHVDEVEHRLDQMMIGHRNDPLMVDRAERVLRHLHILANQIVDAKMQLAEAEARAERLSGAVIRLDGALAGEYGNPTRTPGEIEQDEWMELRPGDLSQQAEGRD
jgi:chromosome segregation ATPase